MALRAEAVDILIEKAKFEPEVAIGIAEAIDVSISQAQIVTIPILDTRLTELRAELHAGLAGLDNRLTSFEIRTDAKFASLGSRMDQGLVALESRMDQKLVSLESRMDQKLAGLEIKLTGSILELKSSQSSKIDQLRADLVRWVFLVMLANIAISLTVKALVDGLKCF